MGEGALTAREGYEAYRFLWLRTFRRPVMVRIENRQGLVTVEAKETDGMGAFAPGKLSEHASQSLSKPQWQSVRDAIDASGFWSVPPAEREVVQGDVEAVADGATWVVEGVRGGEHRVVDLGSVYLLPGNSRRENEQLRDAAMLMLEAAGVDLEQLGEIY